MRCASTKMAQPDPSRRKALLRRAVVAISSDGGFHRSADFGATWSDVSAYRKVWSFTANVHHNLKSVNADYATARAGGTLTAPTTGSCRS